MHTNTISELHGSLTDTIHPFSLCVLSPQNSSKVDTEPYLLQTCLNNLFVSTVIALFFRLMSTANRINICCYIVVCYLAEEGTHFKTHFWSCPGHDKYGHTEGPCNWEFCCNLGIFREKYVQESIHLCFRYLSPSKSTNLL